LARTGTYHLLCAAFALQAKFKHPNDFNECEMVGQPPQVMSTRVAGVAGTRRAMPLATLRTLAWGSAA
jgi:hypothetical protein